MSKENSKAEEVETPPTPAPDLNALLEASGATQLPEATRKALEQAAKNRNRGR